MFVYDREVPPLRQWLALAYSLYREFNFKFFDYNFTIILSKRR